MAILKCVDETYSYNQVQEQNEISRKLEELIRVIKITFKGKNVRYKTLLYLKFKLLN